MDDAEKIVELPIDGVLDLHAFKPGDVKSLLLVYLDECQKKGINRVRVIHGKGTGAMRRTVHTLLERMPTVNTFKIADTEGGGWGATIVYLRPLLGREEE